MALPARVLYIAIFDDRGIKIINKYMKILKRLQTKIYCIFLVSNCILFMVHNEKKNCKLCR